MGIGGCFCCKTIWFFAFSPRVMPEGPGGHFVALLGQSPNGVTGGGMSRWFPPLVEWVLGVTMADHEVLEEGGWKMSPSPWQNLIKTA